MINKRRFKMFMVRCGVRNHVLRIRTHVTVKLIFQQYIQRFAYLNDILNTDIPKELSIGDTCLLICFHKLHMMRLCICTYLPDPSSSPSYMHKTSYEQTNVHKITYLFLIIKAAIINAIRHPLKPPAVIPTTRS